jgi:hypothetical protein
MAVVGEASVIVRAITTGVKNDIQRAFDGADRIGERAGTDAGAGFSRGFNRSRGDVASLFGKSLSQGDVDRFTAARQQFLSLARVGYTLAASLTALGGIIGSVVGGIGSLAAIAAGATPALLGLSGAFLAVAASAAVLRAAFGGVTEAIQAGAKVGQNAAAQAAQIKAATDRANDALYNYNQTLVENAKRKKEAIEAESDASQAVADAAIASERAERAYRDAVSNTEKALEQVTKAREDAKEAIQQLRFELEGGVISEKKARLEFEKARDSLQRVQDLPPNSRARREAELAFAEADLNLRKAIDRNNDLRKANAKANREGVDGNERVVAAQERLVQAQQNESDAQIDAARSVISYKEAIEDLNAARERAIDGGEVDKQNARELELAYRELKNAQDALAEAKKPQGIDEFAAALDKLSPAAQDFVKYILSLKEAFEELRKKLQEAFFPKFTEAIKLLYETYFAPGAPANLEEALIRLAAKLGELSKLFADTFSEPGKAQEVKEIFESFTPIVDALGKAFIALSSAFVALQSAFIPYTIEFAQFIQKKAEALEKTIALKKETGELATIFKDSTDIVRGLGEAIGNTFSALGTIIAASIGPGSSGEYFITWLKDITKGWEDTTKALSESGDLQKFLLQLTQNFTLLLEVIGLIALGLIEIAAAPGFGEFLTSLKEAVIIFNEIGLTLSQEGGALSALGELIVAIAKLTAVITSSEAIVIFFRTLTTLIEGLVFLLDNPFGKALLTVTGTLLAFSAAGGLAFKAVTFYGNAVGGALLNITKFIDVGLRGIGIWSGPATKAVLALRQELVFLTYGLDFVSKRFLLVGGIVTGVIALLVIIYASSEKLRKALSQLGSEVLKELQKAWTEIKTAIDQLLEPLGGVSNIFRILGDILAVTIVPLLKFTLIAAINIIKESILGFISVIQNVVDKWNTLKSTAETVFNKLKEIFGKIGDLSIGDIFAGLKNSFKSAINYVIDGWNKLEFKFDGWDAVKAGKITIIPAFSGFTIGTPNIPRLAEGGIVMPSDKGTLALLAEAGRPERIEPLDSQGLSARDRAMIELLAGDSRGIQITINPSAGMDERELANLVSRQLAFQLRKGAA